MGKIKFGDIVNGQEIIDRIEEIESEYMDDDAGEVVGMGSWSIADRTEYAGLCALRDELGNYPGDTTLIHEGYMTAYIRDYYLEAGGEYHEYNPKTFKMEHIRLDNLYRRSPFNHIDWESVASSCATDYSIVEIDGVTYYYRGD